MTTSVNQPAILSTKLCKITPGEFIPFLVQNNPSKTEPFANGSIPFDLNIPPRNKKLSLNVKWNITNRIKIKIGIPKYLLVNILSALSDFDNS